MNKIITTAAYTALFSSLTFSLSAQDFDTNLDNAKTAYAAKDYELAKLELQDALKVINTESSSLLGKTFPPAPSGWEASELKTASNPMVGTELTKVYKKDKSKITAKIIHNSPLIANYSAIFANPMLMQGEKIRVGRSHAMLTMNEKKHSGELIFLIKSKFLIQLNARNIENKKVITDLFKSWDIKTIKSMIVE